jgi:hypothetical protein
MMMIMMTMMMKRLMILIIFNVARSGEAKETKKTWKRRRGWKKRGVDP